ncbi:MAG: EscU/YscU/HrcU family type III secretion system export apparatus switch protein [Planctomycetota bacterium]
MGLFRDDEGKTELATPTRLNEVRNRGDSPLSKELIQGGVLVVAAVMFRWCGGWFIDALGQAMRQGLAVDIDNHRVDQVSGACREILTVLAAVTPPFVVLVSTLVTATLVLGYGQIGVRWSREVIGFKPEKLNPFPNMKRLFSPQSLVRTGFAAIKVAIITGVLWYVLADRWQVLMHLHEIPFGAAAAQIGDLALLLMLWVGAVVFAISAADLFWQRFDFGQRNMMSKQEVEDERKRSEGDPQMKMRQRRARNELLRHRMLAAVPKADVVVTNPTHFSVALRYDRKRDSAPTVVAKGADEVALNIRELAKAHGVPIMEDPPLARALFRAVKVGQAVPEKFYQAIATVLSHVYRLKGRTA